MDEEARRLRRIGSIYRTSYPYKHPVVEVTLAIVSLPYNRLSVTNISVIVLRLRLCGELNCR